MKKLTMFSVLLMALLSMTVMAQTTVRYVDFKVYDPVYIGVEKGFFKKAGVDVKLTGSVLGGPTAIQAVSAGKAEAGLSSIPAIINANAAGLPIVGVTDIQSALPGQALEEYFVKENSPIKTMADLKGRTFAVNLWKSSFHYTALMALDKAGMAADDVKFQLLAFDKQVQAIMADQVEVVGLMEPYASQLRAQGGYRVLFNAIDVFGTKQFTLHFLNRVWANAHPKEASAFVKGVADSVAWIESNQGEAKKIIAKYTGVDVKYVPEYHFQKNARVINADVQFWIDSMKKMGDLKVDWVEAEDVGTNRYNKAVK